LLEDAVHMVDRARGEAAGSVPAARFEGFRVGSRDLVGPHFGQSDLAEQWDEILFRDLPIALMSAGGDIRLELLEPLVEKYCEGRLGRLDVRPLRKIR
jgi:hypothetical protein